MRKLLPLLVLFLATACSPKVRTNLIESSSIESKNSIASVKVINVDDANYKPYLNC